MSEIIKKKRGRPAKEKKEFMISTESDRLRIEQNVIEASNSKIRIEGENGNIKSIRELLLEELGMPAKLLNEMLTTYHMRQFGEKTAASEQFEETYRKVFKGKDDTID